MIELVNIYRNPKYFSLLYDLLGERTPEQSISHKQMPSYEDHIEFIESCPYLFWAIIEDDHKPVGSVYLTHQREVGIFIFKAHKNQGYASQAIELLREKHPGKLLANVNPMNKPSRDLFEKLGGKIIQVTYEL